MSVLSAGGGGGGGWKFLLTGKKFAKMFVGS